MQNNIDWNALYGGGRDYSPLNDLLLEQILSKMKGSRIAIDLGCGTGDAARKLASKGITVYGYDVSEVAIATAQHKANEAKLADRVSFKVLDLERDSWDVMPRADIILCKLVLAFIADKPAFLSKVNHLLNPDGTFVLITPVLEENRNYNKRLRSISIPESELQAQLGKHFTNVETINTGYFEDQGKELTILAWP